jgi:hypothetical protein
MLAAKPKGKGPLGRPRHRWENNKMDLKEIRFGMYLYGSGEGPVAGSCEYGSKISSSIKGREFVDWLSNYQLHNEYVLWSV